MLLPWKSARLHAPEGRIFETRLIPQLQAWLLVIQSDFQSVEDRDALISHVKAVAVESARNEPQTLGFQVMPEQQFRWIQ